MGCGQAPHFHMAGGLVLLGGSPKVRLLNCQQVGGNHKASLTSGPNCFLKSLFTKYKTNVWSLSDPHVYFSVGFKLAEKKGMIIASSNLLVKKNFPAINLPTISKNDHVLGCHSNEKLLRVFLVLSISAPSHCRDRHQSKARTEWPASLSSEPWNLKSQPWNWKCRPLLWPLPRTSSYRYIFTKCQKLGYLLWRCNSKRLE